MIELENLKLYFERDAVFISDHAVKRFRERGIKIKDVRTAVYSGEIIEQYPDDYPYPSCLILGLSSAQKNSYCYERRGQRKSNHNCLFSR